MKWLGRALGISISWMLLLSACSCQSTHVSPGSNAQPALPFDASSQATGTSPTQDFGAPVAIPAGTVIDVRLESVLSSEGSHSGDQFNAALDEPLIVDGHTFAANGAAIIGRVLTAKGGAPGRPGYLRLTLSSVMLGGKMVDLHTSSLFAKGHRLGVGVRHDVQFSTGRRLTFRLLTPLPLPG